MSIQHTILGMLSCKPLTGYDLKKIMQESSFMPWSGNNNQIYKALLELDDDALVTSQVCHQEGSPSKKIYTISEAGLAELHRWSKSTPELFETKKPFLLQLAWADLLSDEELDLLLKQYELELKELLSAEQKKSGTGFFRNGRTMRETAIWNMIDENIQLTYQTELEWVERLRKTMQHYDGGRSAKPAPTSKKEMKKMTYQVIEKNHQRYLWLEPGGSPIQTEQDVNELFGSCVENGVSLLLIHGDRLSDDFMRLRTGIAGIALQKFVTYHIKTAAVIDEKRTRGKFHEFLAESNRGHVFRSFETMEEAEDWLLTDH